MASHDYGPFLFRLITTRKKEVSMLRLTLSLYLAFFVVMPQAALAQSGEITVPVPIDAAASKISVVVFADLSHTNKLPTAALRQARKDMLDDKPVSDDDLRALAQHHDGLAAQKLVQHLVAAGLSANASDIAYYGSIAVSTGRVQSLRQVVTAMALLDPATEPAERIKIYAAMLYAHAWAGNALALDAVMAMNGEGKLFGPLSDKTRAKIEEQGRKAGDGGVPLRLAVNLMARSDAPAADLQQARAYLQQAVMSPHLSVRTTAANMLVVLDARQAGGVATQ
jgi:hypothetical protein